MRLYRVLSAGVIFAALGMSGCDTVNYHSVNGELPAAYLAYAKPYLGTYRTEGGRMAEVSLEGDRLVLATNFDVTGENCQSVIGAFADLTAFPKHSGAVDPTTPFEAKFLLDTGRCRALPEKTVTFHFNRALTGQAVYEISVTLVEATHDSQGGQPAEVKTWYLKKD